MGQVTEAVIRDIALAEVQRPEPGAAGGEAEEAGVSDGGAAPGVEVAQLVAVGHQVPETRVRHAVTLGHGEIPGTLRSQSGALEAVIPEGGPQLGQLAEAAV